MHSDPHPPLSRREHRAEQSRLQEKHSPSRRRDEVPVRRRRLWVWLVVGLILVVAVFAVWAAKTLYDQATTVRAHLMAAIPYAEAAQSALLSGDVSAMTTASDSFAVEAEAAVAATEGPLWGFAAGLPFAFAENLRGVDLAAHIADRVAVDVLEPATRIDLAALTPTAGAFDLQAIASLETVVDRASRAVSTALDELSGLDGSALLPQVATGLDRIRGALEQMDGTLRPATELLPLLPGALGAEGERNYLVMFQGNAEVRASGGSPGSFLLVRADAGRLEVVRDVASTEFPIDLPEPVIPLDSETAGIYTDVIGRWVSNLTSTPDFPTTAALAKGWWAQKFDDRIDAVVSMDPIALSYLLESAPPVPLPTGETLTSENVVPLLLHEAYFQYPTGAESNVFFSGAAAAVFGALMTSPLEPVAFANALVRAGSEGRVQLWSADEDEAAALGESAFSGVLPSDNERESTVGVFFNDTTGAKMDYFIDAAVEVGPVQCEPGGAGTWTVRVTLTNLATPEDARKQPFYVTGPYYTPGDVATDMVVYTPVGATIQSWSLSGGQQGDAATGPHLGRSVLRVPVLTPPSTSVTLELTMTSAEPGGELGPVAVRHTPMVRDTPITVADSGCS